MDSAASSSSGPVYDLVLCCCLTMPKGIMNPKIHNWCRQRTYRKVARLGSAPARECYPKDLSLAARRVKGLQGGRRSNTNTRRGGPEEA